MQRRTALDLSPFRHISNGGIAINRFYDSDAPVWNAIGKMADVAVLSVLWTICSVPIITMGAASAALMRCSLNMHTQEGNWRARSFFRYFRDNFRNATLLWLVFLLAAAVFIFDIVILADPGSAAMRIQRIIAVIGLILWMITAVWAFALTAQFENGLFQTIKNAFYIGISRLPRTIIMCVLWLVPVALLAFNPYVLSRIIVLWPVLFWGGTAYFCAKLMVRPLTPFFEEAGVHLFKGMEEEDEPEDQ